MRQRNRNESQPHIEEMIREWKRIADSARTQDERASAIEAVDRWKERLDDGRFCRRSAA